MTSQKLENSISFPAAFSHLCLEGSFPTGKKKIDAFNWKVKIKQNPTKLHTFIFLSNHGGFFFSFFFSILFSCVVCLLALVGLWGIVMMEAVTGRGQVPYRSSVLLVWLHPCSRSSKPSYLCKAAPLFDLLTVSSVKWEHVTVLPCKVSWGYGEWTLWNSSCPCETVKGTC